MNINYFVAAKSAHFFYKRGRRILVSFMKNLESRETLAHPEDATGERVYRVFDERHTNSVL